MAIIPGLESKFDEIPAEYDRMRPTYPPELYADLMRYHAIDRFSHVCEVGIGTGQATLSLLRTGCQLTAVELGEHLAAFAAEKFKTYQNLQIQQMPFQQFEAPDNTFDLIYSASAFHWIPPETDYPQVYRLLKPGGVFARFAFHPAPNPNNRALHSAMQELYARYLPHSPETPSYDEAHFHRLAEISGQYGFVDLTLRLYHRVRTFDADGYIALLGTYSDHRAIEKAQRELFFRRLHEVIKRFGNTVELYDTIDLVLARKPL